jgi:hypothetical protein
MPAREVIDFLHGWQALDIEEDDDAATVAA